MRRGEASPVPTPIPVEGDVQIFADLECTQYATGVVRTVYARINVPWVGENSGWIYEGSGNNRFDAYAPGQQHDYYGCAAYYDFLADDHNTPFEVGQVVSLTLNSSLDPIDVTTYDKVFSKP